MKTKQILALSLAVVLSLSLMVGCTKKPSGGTSSGMVSSATSEIASGITSGTSEIASGITSGTSEIASGITSSVK